MAYVRLLGQKALPEEDLSVCLHFIERSHTDMYALYQFQGTPGAKNKDKSGMDYQPNVHVGKCQGC